MSKQEIFTKVYETLRERGFTRAVVMVPAEGGGMTERCSYRSPKGPCAVGIFIPGHEYDEILEGYGVLGIMNKVPTLARFDAQELELLSELQMQHDNATGPLDLRFRLEHLAVSRGLEIPS